MVELIEKTISLLLFIILTEHVQDHGEFTNYTTQEYSEVTIIIFLILLCKMHFVEITLLDRPCI